VLMKPTNNLEDRADKLFLDAIESVQTLTHSFIVFLNVDNLHCI